MAFRGPAFCCTRCMRLKFGFVVVGPVGFEKAIRAIGLQELHVRTGIRRIAIIGRG